MKPLLILLAVFTITMGITKLLTQQVNVIFSAQLGMCAMLCFTAAGHFIFTKGMTMMVPPIVPFKTALVYFTGVLEIVLGIGLLIPAVRMYAGYLLIILFIVLLPANIYAAIKQINYQKGTLDGYGLSYLWFRVPLQFLFIGWIYFSSIKK